jgi:hypothetical protein
MLTTSATVQQIPLPAQDTRLNSQTVWTARHFRLLFLAYNQGEENEVGGACGTNGGEGERV